MGPVNELESRLSNRMEFGNTDGITPVKRLNDKVMVTSLVNHEYDGNDPIKLLKSNRKITNEEQFFNIGKGPRKS
jgi:hypothetical protein